MVSRSSTPTRGASRSSTRSPSRSSRHRPEVKQEEGKRRRRPDLSKEESDSTLVSVGNNQKSTEHSVLHSAQRSLASTRVLKKTQQKVSFCAKITVAADRRERTAEELHRTWYEAKDYDRFAEDCRKYTRIISEQHESNGSNRTLTTFAQAIHDIYGLAKRTSIQTANGSFLTPAEKKRLVRAYKALGTGSKFIGLEYHAVRSLREQAKDLREKLQFTVDITQPYHCPDRKQEQEALTQELRTRCAEITIPACVMAQFLAQVHMHL